MTKAEAKAEFLARYYATLTIDAPGWENADISNFLTQAQYRVIESYALSNIFDPISNLIRIITCVKNVPKTDLGSNSMIFYIHNAESNFLYFVRASCTLNEDATDVIPCEYIQPHEANLYIANSNNITVFRNPKVFIERFADNNVLSQRFIVIFSVNNTDGTANTIGNLYLTYVGDPGRINIATNTNDPLCAINSITHPKIIEEAVKIGVQSLLSMQRQQ